MSEQDVTDARREVLGTLQQATDEVLGQGSVRLTEAMELGDETIDSLDLIEILMVVEDHEGVPLDGDTVGGVTTVGGLVDVILELRTAEAR